MRINNNIMAMNTYRQMGINNTQLAKSVEKLSSGLRINRAGDDAAGLSISEKMRAQIRGLQQASRNAQDGISMIQTAEGALNEVHSILQRMRELAVQAANDTNVTVDRKALDDEFQQLISEIERIANNTQFNEQDILKADFTANIQVGANKSQVITLSWRKQKASSLGEDQITLLKYKVASGVSIALTISTYSKAQISISAINQAIVSVSKSRSKMGALQNRLEHTIANLDNAAENLQAAESRIRDVDMAKEMMNFTKLNILNQAATAMLAQANQLPQAVLQLLR
ncbi:flagellin [Caldicellulosiruptor acetigenus]|uniref:flagellin N-terminal helical domain-containing protein n=1 Tax=Caldicellulosiruptor acetigenus TaxID=301953 RepID=UPI00041A8AAE|nr:flagellin [Caldicellulosiruptor acetigenus]WAM37236.1 flagellin [Caldicellulosiruptor acetigenus]